MNFHFVHIHVYNYTAFLRCLSFKSVILSVHINYIQLTYMYYGLWWLTVASLKLKVFQNDRGNSIKHIYSSSISPSKQHKLLPTMLQI